MKTLSIAAIAALFCAYPAFALMVKSGEYSALGKLRKALAPFEAWLITTDLSWHLIPQTKWILPRLKRSFSEVAPEQKVLLSQTQQLNLRQIRALELLEDSSQSLSISEYRSKFQVSTMTAFRDFTNLLDLKFVLKIGRGRATRYLPGPNLGTPHEK